MTDEAGDILSEKLIIIGDYNGESNAIHEIVKAVKEAQVIQVSKSLMARNLTPPKVHGARAFLPFSGRKITIKQKNEDTLILRANVQKEVAKLSSDNEVFSSRKLELEPKVLDDFLSLLRLVQLGLIAQSTRFSSSQIDIEEAVPLSKIMIDAMKGLDWFLDGDSNEQEVNELLISVTGYHKMWLAKFEKALNEADLSPNLVNKDIDFRSFEYESRFCLIAGTADTIHPRDYLNEALDSSITTPIREVLFNGLRQLFVIESPPVTNTEVSWSIPSLSLKLDTEVDMYKSQRTEAERLLSLLGTNQTNERKTVTKILSDIKGKNRIKKLIDSPPSEISIRLNAILLSGNFDEIILERLSEQVPGVFKHLKKENDNQLTPKEIFTQTEYLRNQIVILDSVLSRIDKQIELLRSSKGGQKEAGQLQTSWAERRGEIQRLKANEQSIEAAEEEIDDLRKNILALETKLKHKQTNVKTDGSVLWLGLGQAGQSILRECLLYCLDNLNDARCSALIRSLGIQDVNVLNDMMLQSKSSDNATRTKAESGLQKLFHRQLHVLAMNLGGEIDDLVLPTEPGYFLWGDEFPESEYSTVRRKTINTIKLDPDQDGAGGKTGVGRAFAFGRENELRDALRDTGSKNGNSPSHIIVTHSFAGGSGSGMVLPVLQLLRSMFDSDAMIWVVSVGEGLSEQRISADYNTPFILSDVLQAHYDGIHSAINPFRVGEWSGYKHELEQYQTRMLKELEDLKALFADDSTGLKSIEEINQSKSLQINRIRDEGMKTLRRLIDKSDLEEFPRWKDADLEKKPFDLLPFEDNETDSFNAWCDKYDENGERPAVKFWNAWVNHVADPLGAVVDCRERGKQQRNKTDSSDGYVPNITSAHIQMALKGAKTKLFPEEKDDENIESVPKREKEHQNLRMLVMYLVNKINEKEDTYQMNETFQKVKEILESYGREVDGFNTLRRDLTNRVRALSKSGNDRGVKSIVISNAHLERGVSKSGIPVTENTYTVYNAVVFDVIMNIIGSQLPSTDYKSGKMEYFDRTDLDNHSLPPMVVGLLQQNDALSLAEPPITSLQSSSNVRTIKSNIHSSKVFDEIFGSNTLRLVKEKMNPFASVGFTSGGKPRLFFESYFGIRTQSMLNINPYDVVGVAPSEALQELTSAIDHHWNE
ncbi:MAG: tubulin-like doman-containing protein, partial [Candidatus Poseidoniaceae archaeon]